VLVVGHGGAGKTTLVHRLEKNTFDPNGPGTTDGIVMSSIMIEDVEFSFLDFAGQEEYDHTHPLFFRSEAVFLVLHNPMLDNLDRLDEFFTMIGDKASNAQVIVVTTRAEEATLEEDKVDELMKQYPNIIDMIAVDSRTNKGIDILKSSLVSAALNESKLPRTITEVPIKFAVLLYHLKELPGTFSLSFQAFAALSQTFSIDAESALIAKELFCFWGMLYELSNGDLVLNPQQLAGVLACVFTNEPGKIARMGDITKGVLGRFGVIVMV
jgi:small GTP-binding protein